MTRRSIRLQCYDYSTIGAYFVTIVTQDRRCLFGSIDTQMRPSDAGRMIAKSWHDLAADDAIIELDSFVLMPNHIHGIIFLAESGRQLLGRMIGAFKSRSTVEYCRAVREHGWPPFNHHLWQRNYYEHVIRNDESLYEIRKYIENNVQAWAEDPYRA